MKTSTLYGYARVSTVQQNTARQMLELEKFGIQKQNIYSDSVSGKDFNRTNYQKLRKKLKKNDVLVVKSLDRLGRNYEEIKNEWAYITKDKKADIVIIDMPLLDTRDSKDLLGKLIADIVLQLLSYVAQSERELIKQRQAEGIAVAKANGTKFGRPPNPYPKGFNKVYERVVSNEITKAAGARELNISPHKMLRFVNRRTQEVQNNCNI